MALLMPALHAISRGLKNVRDMAAYSTLNVAPPERTERFAARAASSSDAPALIGVMAARHQAPGCCRIQSSRSCDRPPRKAKPHPHFAYKAVR